jgi:hypothetical protein
MKLFSSGIFRVASVALSLPILCMCDSYTATVTGTALTQGQSTYGSPTSTITLANGDPFSISLAYSASFGANGTSTAYAPTVTYTGGSALPAASGYDSITVDYLQSYSGAGSFDGTYNEVIPLVLGNYMTASGFATVGTTALPVISLSGPGSYTGTGSADVENLPYGSLTEEYSITFDFFAGAAAGVSGSSPTPLVTPEPSQIIPIALGLAGFGLLASFRRRKCL